MGVVVRPIRPCQLAIQHFWSNCLFNKQVFSEDYNRSGWSDCMLDCRMLADCWRASYWISHSYWASASALVLPLDKNTMAIMVKKPISETPENTAITKSKMWLVSMVISILSPCKKMPRFTVQINSWNTVGEWKWEVNDDDCGICRCPFNGCPPKVKYPGDDCPPGKVPHSLCYK